MAEACPALPVSNDNHLETISASDSADQIKYDTNSEIVQSKFLSKSQQQQVIMDLNLYCCNENHKPILFKTELLKQIHVLKNHSCHVTGCSYYNEFDEGLFKHFEQTHKTPNVDECELCDVFYEEKEKDKHYNTHHVQCNACNLWIIDQQSLCEHEIICSSVVQKEPAVSVSQTQLFTTLSVDKNDTVFNFSRALKKIVFHANLTKSEKEEITSVIDRYASQNLILKARERRGDDSRRHNNLFDCPDFLHTNKPNVKELFSVLGEIKQKDIFDGCAEKSSKKAIENYFQIQHILSRLETVITVCHLSDKHSCVLLEMFLSRNIVDAIQAYCRDQLINLGFAKIIQTLEYLFCPLDLTVIEQKLMGIRKQSSQTMFQFANHCRKLLSLCSRRLPEEEQTQFIEGHLTRLIKNNLKKSILDEVERKEIIFSHFNSTELLDFVLADIHYKGNHRDHFENIGNVNCVHQWGFECQEDNPEEDIYLHHDYSDTDSASAGEEDSESSDSNSKSEHYYVYNIVPKRRNQWRRDILCQYDKKYARGIHCFFCLGPHPANRCDAGYSGPFSEELCIKDGEPCGFHEVIDCLKKFSHLPQEPKPVFYTTNDTHDNVTSPESWPEGQYDD